jgi:hypothetical protein
MVWPRVPPFITVLPSAFCVPVDLGDEFPWPLAFGWIKSKDRSRVQRDLGMGSSLTGGPLGLQDGRVWGTDQQLSNGVEVEA